jgi:hypothetical protein
MASPFKVFRKHQKVWLAGLTILAMFSFVFLGTISDLLGTRQSQNPVVVRTSKYGKLTQRDLFFMRQDRMKALAVLQMMLIKLFPPQIGSQIGQTCQQYIEITFGKNTEEDIVMNWLKARRAEEIGMTISNDTINEFLKAYPLDFARYYPQLLKFVSEKGIPAQDVSAMITQQNLTQNQFFDIMRNELRALEVGRLFVLSLQGITPAERWEYFCRIRKQATVELIPVEVEQFIDQVNKNPSEEELNALFEKYKDKLPNPLSPEPGFRIPHKIEVQYFKADIAKFSDPAAITDEEFQSAYEKNRAYFDKLEKESTDSSTPGKKGSQEKTSAEEKKETPAGDEKPLEQAKEKAKEQAKEQPADVQKPADQPAADQEKSPKENTKKGDAKKSSAVDRSPFTLTAMAEQAEKPAAEGPKAEKPAAEPPKVEKSPAEGAKTEKPAANPPAQPEKAEKAKPVLSEKTKERIRAQAAREKIQTIFLQLQQKMEENGKKWRKYEAEKINKKAALPPPSLDFEGLAKKYGLSAGQTGLISNWEAQKFDIGSSYMGEELSPFTNAAFKSLNTYKPESAVDTQGNAYLFWKINDVPESAPSLEDKNVRQEVIHAWKLIKARELAHKHAESLAEAAAKTGATLKGALPDIPQDQIISPTPFSMFTEGSIPRGSSSAPPRLSEVKGAPLVGLDFMRVVFNMDINQIGVAMNAPQTVVYVVQLINYSPPQDVLWQIFLAEDFSKYATIAVGDLQADHKAWLESLKTSAGLQWEIKPEQPRGEPAPASIPEED